MASRILVVDDSPTIRRVVSAILERHGYEPQVASDGEDAYEALASGEVKADLVLVDFVMPRMNGYQLCRALREHKDLSLTPVVLMSAKADRIRDQFVQQTGALDAITKPFDAQALVAVVENALRRVNTSRASSTRLPDADAEDVTSQLGPGMNPAAPQALELETRRTQVAQIVATQLANIVERAITERPEATGTELIAMLTERLANEAILEMVEAVRDLSGAEGVQGPILSGDLGIIPIGAILQLLQVENQTGVLVCSNDAAVVRATFRAGLIDLVQSTGTNDEFRLGRFFIEEGILTPLEIETIMSGARRSDPPASRVNVKSDPAPETIRGVADLHARTTMPGSAVPATIPDPPEQKPRPLGMALLAAGKIVESQLRTALTKQSSELLYEVLRWQKGRFELRREMPSELADSARLGMPVASAVMEGFRRVDEWRVLERTIGDFDAVLVRDDAAFGTFDVASLPPREKIVLDSIDGERTVRAIIAASHMSSFDACRILVQLLEARVLRRRTNP